MPRLPIRPMVLVLFVIFFASATTLIALAQSQETPQASTAQSGILHTVSKDLLREALKPLGLNWIEKVDSDGLTSFHMQEGETVRFTLYQYRNSDAEPVTSLGISAGYSLQVPVTASKINDWNGTTRFTKAYFDNEGDPFLTQDLDLAGGVSLKAITEFVRSFHTAQPQFEKQVLGRQSDQKPVGKRP